MLQSVTTILNMINFFKRELTADVNAWRGTPGYKWKDMVTTFTGNAIENVLPNFQKATNGTKASKASIKTDFAQRKKKLEY